MFNLALVCFLACLRSKRILLRVVIPTTRIKMLSGWSAQSEAKLQDHTQTREHEHMRVRVHENMKARIRESINPPTTVSAWQSLHEPGSPEIQFKSACVRTWTCEIHELMNG